MPTSRLPCPVVIDSMVDIFAVVQVSTPPSSASSTPTPSTQADRSGRGCAVDRVVTVAPRLIEVDVAVDLAEMFRLLGDPTRVRILFALLEAGELRVCDIAEVVETSDTKVSQAMRLLRNAGIVRNRRDGRHIHYRLDDDHVRQLLDLSRTHLSHRSEAG